MKIIFNYQKLCVYFFAPILILGVFIYSPILLSPFQKPIIKPYPNSNPLTLNPLNHFRQSLNNCGSYAVAGVLNVFDDKLVDPEEIANSISYKFKDRFTLPIGLESYLKNKGMNVENNNTIGLSELQKIDYLKYQLSSGKAGILLVKIPDSPWYYLHYITILGYDESSFYVYDSLAPRDSDSKFTIDTNGPQPGNKSIPAKELIQIWDAGNILNYPKNYNLFVKPN
jgi:Peptidase_C39 like family